jgi:hypothetical protein
LILDVLPNGSFYPVGGERVPGQGDTPYVGVERLMGKHRAEDAWETRRTSEQLQMQLAACGVAAMSNTPETVAQRITRDNPYWSASYGDVCAAVDREMLLRSQLAEAREKLADGIIDRMHTAVGVCGCCGSRECAGRKRHSVLPTLLPETVVLEAIRAALGEGK